MSGIALAAKHIKPQIEMLGVEVKLYPSMYPRACAASPRAAAARTLAEGIAVKNVTERTIAICKQYVDDVRLVGRVAISSAR